MPTDKYTILAYQIIIHCNDDTELLHDSTDAGQQCWHDFQNLTQE
jgi:hypothetical protein